MNFLLNIGKKFLFWTYPRTSWQWDVLCVLILVFIFLTPKGWFENTEYRRSHAAQTTIVMQADLIGNQADRANVEQRARDLSGRPDARITAMRERRDTSGQL